MDNEDARNASASAMEDFMQHYPFEKPFYEQIAHFVVRNCQIALKANPQILVKISDRVKETSSLRQKLRKIQDEKKQPWQNAQEIWDNIFDIVGIRIVLYLPSQSELVEDILEKMVTENGRRFSLHKKIDDFKEGKQTKEIVREQESGANSATYKRRFPGYLRKHYQLRVATASIYDESDDSDENVQKEHRRVGVEIQIVSASIHTWAEIEHDIEYKKHGTPSSQERRLLEGYQRIMSAVEIFLEQLEKTWSDRIAEPKKRFEGLADLMSFLQKRISTSGKSEGCEPHLQSLLQTLIKFGRNSQEQLDEVLAGLGFLEPSNSNLLSISHQFEPLKLRPCVAIMANMFRSVKNEELMSAYNQEANCTGNSKEIYRCRVLIDCLKWLIADLFEPPEEVSAIFRKICESLSEKEFDALRWVIDGSSRADILLGEGEPDERERNHINNMWHYFSSCEEPMIEFAFRISRLGIQAPGSLYHIKQHTMYDQCLSPCGTTDDPTWTSVSSLTNVSNSL